MKKTKKVKKMTKAKKIFCVICPKWEIKRPERCSNTKVHKGIKKYFCTKKCIEKFEKSPESYL